MAGARLKNLWKKELFKTFVALLLVVCVLGIGYLTLQIALGTSTPVRVVGSGSMCTTYDDTCKGFLSLTHPFDQTLHTGDLILVQSVNPKDLKTDYPNSDIIIYKNPYGVTPIVHRIVAKQEINGTLYFHTKGDGNPLTIWPHTPSVSEYDDIPGSKGVPENLVEGKVVMRIPWLGWVALVVQNNNWVLPLIIIIIVSLAVVEYVLPVVEKKKQAAQQLNKPSAVQMYL